jgi:flagellar motor switch protein FliG
MATDKTAAILSGDQKAAILVLLLGEQVTGEMFKHLSQREVARIAREVSQLGAISDVLAQDVLNEYYLNAVHAPHEHGGPDAARRILARASISEEIADQLLGAEAEQSQDLLGPLLEAPPDVLARALQDEHPQTAALVLLHLPPRRAAKLLRALPEPAQAETVLRMATLRQVRGAVLGEVAQSLRERLGSLKGQETQGGLERTTKVLAAMARSDTRRVLQELEPDHPDEVMLLRSELFTFESLELADDRGMQELLRNLDSGKIALAITGAPEALQARFMGNLSERAAAMLKDEMEFLGTPNPADLAAARKEVLDLALKLEADGSLTFGQPSLDDEDEHA